MTTHFQMYYIILHNITYIQNIYHLVMTNIAMERSTHFKFGKPSISTRAIYTMAMLVITRLGSFFFFGGTNWLVLNHRSQQPPATLRSWHQ